jgi:putative FmdB family regulatory protein
MGLRCGITSALNLTMLVSSGARRGYHSDARASQPPLPSGGGRGVQNEKPRRSEKGHAGNNQQEARQDHASIEDFLMPIYEYKCGDCGHVHEVITTLAERDTPPPCPECKSGEVRRLISRSSFALKGGGWYKDGYSKGQ